MMLRELRHRPDHVVELGAPEPIARIAVLAGVLAIVLAIHACLAVLGVLARSLIVGFRVLALLRS